MPNQSAPPAPRVVVSYRIPHVARVRLVFHDTDRATAGQQALDHLLAARGRWRLREARIRAGGGSSQ